MSFEERFHRAQDRLTEMKKAVPKKVGNYILSNYKTPKGERLDGPNDFKKYYKVVAKFNKGDKESGNDTKSDKSNDKSDDADEHSANNKPKHDFTMGV